MKNYFNLKKLLKDKRKGLKINFINTKVQKSNTQKTKVKETKENSTKEKNTKILNSKILIILFILIILIILLFISSFSLGKQLTDVSIDTNAQIAKPILVVENNPAIDINNKNNKGSYDFKVKNYNEVNEINQVPLKYSIEILTKTDESISFKLYKDNQEVALINNKTDEMLIKPNEKQEETYKLEIVYDSGKSVTNKNILEQVQIKVHSEQVKL